MSGNVAVEAKRTKDAAARKADSIKDAKRSKPPSLQATVGNRALAGLAQKPHVGSLRGRVVFDVSQGPKGFALHHWEITVDAPADGLTAPERAVLDTVIQGAVFESESKYAHYFAGTIEARRLELPLSMRFEDLSDDRSRGLAVFHIGDNLRALIEGTRNVEQAREQSKGERAMYPPRPGLTIDQELARESTNLREEIARIRKEMKAGLAEQVAANKKLAQFAAFLATSPAPDLGGWNTPETYLRSAEASLADKDPRGANMFMDVARVSLKSQQDWWNRYKHDYAFGDEVIGPVFWQALSLFSLGIVDEKLFDISEEGAKKGFGNQLVAVAHEVVSRVGNLITFGGYEGWKKGVEKRIAKAPNDPLWRAMVLAGPDAVQGVIDTMLPLQEIDTMMGKPIETEGGRKITPDFWMRVGAFFSAVLKVLMLAEMAKGHGQERTGAPEGYGERGEGAKQETMPRSEQTAKQPTNEAGDPYGHREGYGERGEAAKKETTPGTEPIPKTEAGENYGFPEGYGEMGEAAKQETTPGPPEATEAYGERGEAAKQETTPRDDQARTAAGTRDPRAPARTGTLAPLEPGSPRAALEQWTKEVSETGLSPREGPGKPRGPELEKPGTYTTLDGRTTFKTPHEAMVAYDEALARAGGREVGIFRRFDSPTAEYVVRIGDKNSVRPPYEGVWDSVLHHHPNPENVLTRRMPAPQDVYQTLESAGRGQRPVTEFIDYPLPDGKRGLVSYTVEPQTGEVTIRWEKEPGKTIEEHYPSIEAYAEHYGERTTFLDPKSAEYKWIKEYLRKFFKNRDEMSDERTARGALRIESGAEPKSKAKAKSDAKAKATAKKPKLTAEQKRIAQLEKHVARELNPKKNKNLRKERDPMEERPELRDPTAEEALDDPTLDELVDEAEEGGGTRQRGEGATIGSADEAAEVRKWRGELAEKGYKKIFTAKGKFKGSKPLEKVFTDVEKRPSESMRRKGGPDVVAVDDVAKKVLVGDVTSEFGNVIPEEFGSGDRLHIEKTREDARRVADMPEFADYEIVAQERYWKGESAGKTTKEILIRPKPKKKGP